MLFGRAQMRRRRFHGRRLGFAVPRRDRTPRLPRRGLTRGLRGPVGAYAEDVAVGHRRRRRGRLNPFGARPVAATAAAAAPAAASLTLVAVFRLAVRGLGRDFALELRLHALGRNAGLSGLDELLAAPAASPPPAAATAMSLAVGRSRTRGMNLAFS